MRVAALWDRDTNDPALVTVSRSNQYLPMYEALVEYDEFAQYVPMLATNWETSPDAKSLDIQSAQGSPVAQGLR